MASNNKKFEGIFFQTGRLNNEFVEEDAPIGSGSFGIVTRAKHLVDDKDYAIKKIRIEDKDGQDRTIRERKMWAKLDCDFFVQYRSSWVELSDDRVINQFKTQPQFSYDSTDFGPKNSPPDPQRYAVLHIQMDLCTFSLREAIEQLKKYFKLDRKQLLPTMGYYVSSELLLEILDCIKYLHEMSPQILHRDIKPENILIKWGRSGRFVRISDFGGAVEHEQDQSHTRMYGTLKYMAPEVMSSRKYDSSADVYSISIMTQEMFNLDINTKEPMDRRNSFLRDFIVKSMSGITKERPTCKDWIKAKNQWALDYESVRNEIYAQIDVNKEYDINTQFVELFLKTKCLINK